MRLSKYKSEQAHYLTRNEFAALYEHCADLGSQRDLGVIRLGFERLKATIKAGGFAPEPVSEYQVWEWLHGFNVRTGAARWHDSEDLLLAMQEARAKGISFHFETSDNGKCFQLRANDLTFRKPAKAALALAALAYRTVNPDSDVSHLLGGTA